MTFVEFFVFLAGVGVIYFLLRPLQKRLESNLRKFFRSRSKRPGSVIDITDYSKKDPKK